MSGGTPWTAGPWEVVGEYFDVYQRGSSEYICQSSKSQGARRDANARLIAAAPEMAEALREVDQHFGPFAEITINGAHDAEDVRVINLVRTLLAKIGGVA